MGELAQEYKQKIAAFDNPSAVSEKEKDVIFYVESWARDMPPAYLNKLISAIEVKLKNKELSKDQIRQECQSARDKLNKEISDAKKWTPQTILESISNTSFTGAVNKITRNMSELVFDTNKKTEEEVNAKL